MGAIVSSKRTKGMRFNISVVSAKNCLRRRPFLYSSLFIAVIFMVYNFALKPSETAYKVMNPFAWGDYYAYDPYIELDNMKEIDSSEVTQHCSSIKEDFLAPIIVIRSVKNNVLSHLGGTGHWYHFLQRIIPMLGDAYSKVWGPHVLGRRFRVDEIYILFEEEFAVNDLGPFGRFIITSILTGGKFFKVHIGYAEKIYTNDQRSLVSGLHVLFTVDLATQTKTEIFVDNARVKAVTSEGGGISNYLRPKVAPIQLCAVTLLKVPLISIRRKLQWLTSERNLTQFTESYTGFTESLTMSLTVSLTVSFTVSLTDSLTVSHRFVRHRTRKSCTID